MTRAPLVTDAREVRRYWDAVTEPGQVYEVTALEGRGGPKRWYGATLTGYFDDPEALCAVLEGASGRDAEGIYLLPNPVPSNLRARVKNRLKKTKTRTQDAEVLRRCMLVIDHDPVRPAGMSATDAEQLAALKKCTEVRQTLRDEFGWSDPLCEISSGNGAALLYPIDLENTDEATVLVQRVLAVVSARFTDERVIIDTTTFNAARLYKLPGTIAAKGEDFRSDPDEPDRPWRRATAQYFESTGVISADLLQVVADTAPQDTVSSGTRQGSTRTWTVQDLIAYNDLKVKGPAAGLAYRNGRKWPLVACPCPEHLDGSCFFERSDGALAFSCRHTHCQAEGRSWAWLRQTDNIRIPPDPSGEEKSSSCGKDQSNGHRGGESVIPARLCLTPFNAIEPETVEWMMPGFVAYGKLTALLGPPDMGKSLTSLHLAAQQTKGGRLPRRDDPLEPGYVIVATKEDDFADTVRPRLDWAGFDPDMCAALEGVDHFLETGERDLRPFFLDGFLDLLEQGIKEKSARLLIVDPFSDFLLKVNPARDTEMRTTVLTPLRQIAARHSCAILLITHIGKQENGISLYRALNSVALGAVARSAIGVGRDPYDEHRYGLVPLKGNLSAPTKPLGYRMEQSPDKKVARIAFDEEDIALTRDTVFKGLNGEGEAEGDRAWALQEAKEFLLHTLTEEGGHYPKHKIVEEAKTNGISEASLKRAKGALSVDHHFEGRVMFWDLPATEDAATGSTDSQEPDAQPVDPVEPVAADDDSDPVIHVTL